MTGLCRRLGNTSAIISFHSVLPHSFDSSSLIHNVDLAAQTFEQQLELLTNHYDVRPASEIHSLAQRSERTGVFLSFDDGLLNNYVTIEPILDKFGLTAVFAVCPAFVNRDVHFIWRDWLYLGLREALANKRELPDMVEGMESASLEECFRAICPKLYCEPSIYSQLAKWFSPPDKLLDDQEALAGRFLPMTWEQIASLDQKGHVIASHAMTHRPLAILDDAELLDELQQSRKTISDILNKQCRALVYPYGNYKRVDSRSIQLAQKAGYDLGFMNIRQSTGGVFALPRFGLPNTTSSAHLVGSVSGFLNWWR